MSGLTEVITEYKRLGIDQQIDYEKFYLYSIITHSTAIEGSTVTEIENRMLFDKGISANKPMIEQLMNLDLKNAYDRGFEIADEHEAFSTEMLCSLAGILMRNTGSIYNTVLGSFSSADGDLRLVNVSAGGGKSYMAWQKVPEQLKEFTDWLNRSMSMLAAGNDAQHGLTAGVENSRVLDAAYIESAYRLSFMAHYRLVTIHPWADGNGRMARLVMNIVQREMGVPLSVVRKESRVAYIQSLSDSQDADDSEEFLNFMTRHHIQIVGDQIEEYKKSIGSAIDDNANVVKEIIHQYGTPGANGASKLSSNEQAVYDQMKTEPGVTIAGIMDSTGFSRPTVTRMIKALKDKGLIERIGANKNGYWGVKGLKS